MLGTISEMLRSGVEERLAKEDLVQLLEGSLFWKVRSNNWYPRRFWLDLNNLCIRYEPSKKPFWTTPITHGNLDIYVTEVQDIFKKGKSIGTPRLRFIQYLCALKYLNASARS